MAETKVTRDVRRMLSGFGRTLGNYSISGAKLFLATGQEIFKSTMPTVSETYTTNKETLTSVVHMLRKPSDAINVAIGRATNTEDYNSIMKFVKYALDDLKSGKLYDKDRDRSSAFSAIDDMMDSFGGFDMTGFDENGDWTEPDYDMSSLKGEAAIAEVQEENAAKRTSATIDAIAASTDAVTKTVNAGTQANIRLALKQHAETLNTLNNSLSVQTASLKTMGEGISSILDVSREAHAQMMSEVQKTNTLLTEIRDQLKPVNNTIKRKQPDDIFGTNGELNIKNYFKQVIRNIDDKLGIRSTASIATGGMSLGMLADLAVDNPWQFILSPVIGSVIPKSLKKQMEITDKNIRNFLPALFAKLSGHAERKRNETGEASIIDEFISMLGVKPATRTSIDTTIEDANSRGLFSKKTSTAIEIVIPALLSQINSSISGAPMMVYDYKRGMFVKATSAISQYTRQARDVVGSASSVQTFMQMSNAYNFKSQKMRDEFNDFMYEYFQKKANSDNPFINPYDDKYNFMDELPYHNNRDEFYQLIMGMFKAMNRSDIMQMSSDLYHSKLNRNQRNDQINQELRDNGLIAAFSGLLDYGIVSDIKSESDRKRFGLSDRELDNLVGKHQLEAVKRGGVQASNILLNDILGTLKKGLIVYSYNMADVSSDSGKKLMETVLNEARKQRDLESQIREYTGSHAGAVDRQVRSDEARSEQRMMNSHGRLSDIIVNGATIEDLAATIVAAREADIGNTENQLASWFRQMDADMHGRTDQVMQKTGIMSIFNKIQNAMSSPFGLLEEGLKTVDAFLFKIIYGQDAGVLLANGGTPSLMKGVTNAVQVHFQQAKDWFITTIGDPIRNFLFDKDKGLFPKIRQFFDPMINNAKGKIKTRVSDVAGRIRTKFAGNKVTDDDGNERYEGGVFSSTINRVTGKDGEVEGSIKSAINRLLYGKYSSEKRKGVKETTELNYGPGGAMVPTDKAEYGGVVGRFKQGFDKVNEFLFGRDDEIDEEAYAQNVYSKKRWRQVTGELGKAFPSMVTRGGAGFLAGMFLPGGPLLGAIVGSTSGFVKSSENLKNFLFGDELEEDHVDPVTGKVTKRKSRKGNLISKEVYDGIAKFAPNVTKGTLIGSIAGGIGLLPFGLGSTAGMLIGSIGGMIKSSDQLRELIFGNITDPKSGLISKEFRDKAKEKIKQAAPPAIAGALAGSGAWNMISSLGIIPGLSLLPGGPIFSLLGGITGATNAEAIQKFFFGEEATETVEEDDGKGGKKTVSRKVRKGGVFGKMFDFAKDNMLKPFAKRVDDAGKKVSEWFKGQIVTPFSNALQPMKDQFKKAGEAIGNSFKNIGSKIADGIKEVFHLEVGKPLGETVKEKILKPLDNIASKIFGTIGKVIGNILSAPFKAVELMFAGTIGGKTLAQRKQERKDERKRRKDERRQKRLDKRAARRRRRGSRGINIIDDFTVDGSGNIVYVDAEGKTKPIDDFSTIMEMGESEQDSLVETLMQQRDKNGLSGQVESLLNKMGVDSKNIPGANPEEKMDNMIGILRGNIAHQREKARKAEFYQDYGYVNVNGTLVPVTPDILALPAPGQSKVIPQSDADLEAQELGYASAAERERLKGSKKTVINQHGRTKDRYIETASGKIKIKRGRRSKSKSGDVVIDAAIEDARQEMQQVTDEVREENKEKVEQKKEEEKKNKKPGRKSDNDYLKSISKNTAAILDEIKGQLGGLGWNVAYIKTLLEAVFHRTLTDDELPEEMEGSRKNVRKRRGVLGKIKDKVFGIAGGVKDRVSGVLDAILSPFRKIKEFGEGVVDAFASITDHVRDFAGTVLGLTWKGVKKGGKLAGRVLLGTGRFVKSKALGALDVLGKSLVRFGGFMKEAVRAIGANVAGLIQTAFEIAPTVASKLWKGGKFALSKLLGGAKFVGKGIAKGVVGGARLLKKGVTGLFGKIFGRDKSDRRNETNESNGGNLFERLINHFKTQRMNVVVKGGHLDSVKSPITIDLSSKGKKALIPFPYVHVIRGKALKRVSNVSIPVYITGVDSVASIKTRGNDDPNKIKRYVRAYTDIDRAAERAGSRAPEVYDRALQNATTQEEISAIRDAQQLNSGNGLLALPNGTGNGLAVQDDKGGILQDLLSGGAGGLLVSGAKLLVRALPYIASVFAIGYGATKDGEEHVASRGIESAAQTVLSNTGFRNLTIKQLKEIAKDPSTAYATKSAAEALGKKGVAKGAETAIRFNNSFIGRTINSVKNSAVGKAAGSAINAVKTKAKGLIRSALDKLFNNATVKAMLGTTFGKQITKMKDIIISKLCGESFEKAMRVAGTETAESAVRSIGGIATGGLLTIGFAVYDFISGWNSAYQIFNVHTSQVTIGMKVVSALYRAVSGLISALPPPIGPIVSIALSFVEDPLVQALYDLVGTEEGKEELAKNQAKVKAAAAEAGMTVDEYTKKFDENGNERPTGFFGKLGEGIKAIGSGIWNGIKGIGSGIASLFGFGGESGSGYGTGSVSALNQRSSKYNRGSNNMSLAGCGPTAASMVASAYGKKLDPQVISDLSYRIGMRASDGGTDPRFFNQMSGMFGSGFGMDIGPNDPNAVYGNVKHGRPVIMMGRGGPFGNHMHYLVADGTVGTGKISYVDPMGGARKSANLSDFAGTTKSTIYSWGTGANNGIVGTVTDTVNNALDEADPGKVATAQGALVSQMKWLQQHPINYSLASDKQNPDKGSASCASTVGWAYRKALGIDNMSASSSAQSQDSRFSDVIRIGPPGKQGGKTFDLSALQPGDIVYMYNKFANGGGSNHTEMYIGDGKDLSHGGPGWDDKGPNEVALDASRQKRVFAVRRLNDFLGKDYKGPITYADSSTSKSTSGESDSETNESSSFEGWLGNTVFGKTLSAISSIGSSISSIFESPLNAISSALGFSSSSESEDGESSGESVDTNVVTGNTSSGTSSSKDTIWKHLIDRGYSKIAASGIMGCWEKESTNQPNRIEGDYLKSFPGFSEVTASNDALNKYTTDVLFPAYAKSGISVKKDAYIAQSQDGNYYPGLGLAQWTGPRGYKLFNYAKKSGAPWNELDTQLSFFDSETGSEFKSKINSARSTYDATKYVLDNYEMYPGFSSTKTGQSTLAQRSMAASKIYDTYGAGPGLTRDIFGTGTTDVNLSSLQTRIRKMNVDYANARNTESTDTSANNVIEAMNGIKNLTLDNSKTDGILETIATSIATMVQLLQDIKNNTSSQDKNSDNIKGKYDSIPKTMSDDYTMYKTGAQVIDRLTAKV